MFHIYREMNGRVFSILNKFILYPFILLFPSLLFPHIIEFCLYFLPEMMIAIYNIRLQAYTVRCFRFSIIFNQTMAFLITHGVLFGICLAFIYFEDGSDLNFSKSSVP